MDETQIAYSAIFSRLVQKKKKTISQVLINWILFLLFIFYLNQTSYMPLSTIRAWTITNTDEWIFPQVEPLPRVSNFVLNSSQTSNGARIYEPYGKDIRFPVTRKQLCHLMLSTTFTNDRSSLNGSTRRHIWSCPVWRIVFIPTTSFSQAKHCKPLTALLLFTWKDEHSFLSSNSFNPKTR